MFLPALSCLGSHRKLRIAGLSAILVCTSTGAVLAANPGCQVAIRYETVRASMAVARKVHHTAATLARWKVGAAAWSKAHGGKVYRGHPPVQTATVLRPSTYSCRDIAVDAGTIWPMLLAEPLPDFSTYASGMHPEASTAVDLAVASNVPAERDQLVAGFSGLPSGNGSASASGGIGSPNGPVGSASLLSTELQGTSPHARPLPPKHSTEEVDLSPPAPPVVLPTPEPSAVVLLGTGIVTLGVGVFRRRFTR